MKKCGLLGIIGIFLIGLGVCMKLRWMEIVGIVLAAPIFWVYFTIIFIFLPMLIFGKIRRGGARTGSRPTDNS